jgi:hypothetical protein
MSLEIGGKATSAVPVGTSGRSTVAAVAGAKAGPCVVATCAGDWMTPIVGGVFEFRSRSSSDREKPYTTSAPATTTPAVTAISVVRERRFDSGDSGSVDSVDSVDSVGWVGSTTTTTLQR